MQVKIEIEAPSTEREVQLAQIWADLLKVDISKIGRHTSFFELGGDSISAIQLVAQAEKFGFYLQSAMIFKKPTLIQMAKEQDSQQKFEIKPLIIS